VQALRNVRAWDEIVEGQTDILVRVDDNIINLSSTAGHNSTYPSVDAFYDDVVSRTLVNAVWTEELVPNELYEVAFKQYEPEPGFGPGSRHPRYVAVATGDSSPSPYCEHRDGGIKYGPYSLDYARESLRYKLTYLDPVYDYWVRAVVYHEGKGRWSQSIRLDDSLGVLVEAEPQKPETIWVQIPAKAYQKDGIADLAALKHRGLFSLVTDFAVYQAEPQRRGQGRRLDAVGELSGPLRATFFSQAPNPSTGKVLLSFGLNRPGEVSLRVFDASGRLVRALVDGKCLAGVRAVTWDGHDLRGRRVANGIYFAKLQAEEDVQVRKVVLTR